MTSKAMRLSNRFRRHFESDESTESTTDDYIVDLKEFDLVSQVNIDLERIDSKIAMDSGHAKHICRRKDKLLGISLPVLLINFILVTAIIVFGNLDCTQYDTLEYALSNVTVITFGVCTVDNLEWYIAFVFLLVIIDGLFLVRFVVHILLYMTKLCSKRKHKFVEVHPIEASSSTLIWSISILIVYLFVVEFKLGDIKVYTSKVMFFNIILWVSLLVVRILIKLMSDFAQKSYNQKIAALKYKKKLLKGLVPNLKEFLKCKEDKVLKKAHKIFDHISKKGKIKKRNIDLLQKDRNRCWEMMTEDKSISKEYFGLFMCHFWKYNQTLRSERQNRGYIDSIISALFYVIYGLVISTIFLTMFIANFDLGSSFLSFTSLILGFSFVFGTTLRKFFDGIIFIIFDKNYKVGEKVIVDGHVVIIDEISLRQTIGFTPDGRRMTWANYNIMEKRIENHSVGSTFRFNIDVKVGFGTTVDQISLFRKAINEFVELQPDFSNTWFFYINEISTEEIKISLVFILIGVTWDSPPKYLSRQTRTNVFVHNLMKQLRLPVTVSRRLNMTELEQVEQDDELLPESKKLLLLADLS
eukprot:TRINITY_DN7665_c0_g1_i1.p1 TRINITY_DN7665_c0_g1~~TRINITY_DN7665_c0_g1_i1.p1  ORF type:complete len:583 (+),score=88.95 TRINITY_DN7665_c0_g1_i1:33-1781(+)